MNDEQIKKVKELVESIQKINAKDLSRQRKFGEDLNFQTVVEPARKIIGLYDLLYLERLADFSLQELRQLESIALRNLNKFKEVLDFKIVDDDQNFNQERKRIITSLTDNEYDNTLKELRPFITYQAALMLKLDFAEREKRLEGLQRKIEKEIGDSRDQYGEMLKELQDKGNKQSQEMLEQAQEVLDKIRGTSSELGVSQQAHYFMEEADRHEKLSEQWKTKTNWTSFILFIYSILAIFSYSWFSPADTYGIIQIVTGKMLAFSVLAYMLFLSSRNFLSHKHNAIINKHRQNALMTFRSLVDAARQEDHSDIVLLHAAQCIFSLQETGYAKQDGGGRGMPPSPIDFRRISDDSKQN